MIEGESGIKEKAIEMCISAIAIAEEEGNLVYVNPSFLRMWGYDDEKEVLGNTAVEFWQMQEQAAEIIQALRDTRSWVGELTATRKDGTKFDVQLSASMVTDKAGNPINMMGSFVDITEKKRLEHDLRERAKELSCLYDIARIAAKEEATFDDICQGVANLLPASWSHSEIVGSRITINGSKFETENYRDTEWKQVSDIKVYGEKVGVIEIGYLEESPEFDEGPFTKEEGLLLDAVAERLGSVVEQEQAEQALKRSEERLQLILNSTPDAIIYTDLSVNILDCNPSTLTMFGFSAQEELIGKSGLELLNQEVLPEAREGMQRVIKQGRSDTAEYTCKTKDGREFPVEVSAGVVYSHTGEPTGVVTVVRDITERKQAEEALRNSVEKVRESEEKFRSIVENSSDQIFMLDKDYKFLSINMTAADISNKSPQEMIGTSVFEMFPEDTAVRFSKNIKNVFDTVKSMLIEEKMLVQGREFYNSTSLNPVKDDQGNVIAVTGIVRDITEQKQASEKLRESEARYRALFETKLDGMIVIDETTKILLANQAFADMLGFDSSEEIYEINLLDYVMPEFQEWAVEHITVGLFQDDRRGLYEIRCMKKNGDEIWVSVTGIKTEYDGKPVGIISARDITEGKRAEQEIVEKNRELEEANVRLQEVDRLKSNFLSSISHELRTPLNSIIGFTSLILDGMTGDINDEQREQLTLVKSSSHHLLSLINDVLDISKIEAGRVELILEEFPLNELVSEVAELLTPTAQTKGIELIAETDRDIRVYTDRCRFKQVLINLGSNAVKFTEQGCVRIITGLHKKNGHIQDGSLEIHVIDTGIGIKKEDIGKLFAPFQQVDGSLTRRFEGTGLGLHHSKKILTMLGGDIRVKSKCGKGSDFALTLPLRCRGDEDNEKSTGSG